MIIVSDAGPLIALAKTNHLNILQELFQKVIIPPSVFDELKISTSRPGANELKKAIERTKWLEVSGSVHVPGVPFNSFAKGEVEAIILAKTKKMILLIDERRARRIAKKENVKITGTGAVLVAAKRKGIIKKVSLVLDELTEEGYRISEGLRKRILELAEE